MYISIYLSIYPFILVYLKYNEINNINIMHSFLPIIFYKLNESYLISYTIENNLCCLYSAYSSTVSISLKVCSYKNTCHSVCSMCSMRCSILHCNVICWCIVLSYISYIVLSNLLSINSKKNLCKVTETFGVISADFFVALFLSR